MGLFAIYLLASCSSTRYITSGERLLTKSKITYPDDPHEGIQDLESYITQKPNHKLFGVFNWSLGIYNLNNLSSNSFINRQLRRWGTPPVIYSPEETEQSMRNLTSAMYNAGYLRATTKIELDSTHRKKIRVNYLLEPGEPFHIQKAYQSIASKAIDSLIHPVDTLGAKRLSSREQYASLLQDGGIFSPRILELERRRIAHILRNRGYWGFQDELVRFEADTLERTQVWVNTRIDTLMKPYYISSVRLRHAGAEAGEIGVDSLVSDGISIYVPSDRYLSPKALRRRLWIKPGELYSLEHSNKTYSALADLGTIKDITISFVPDTTAASPEPRLRCEITTSSERSKEFSVDAVGTHSSGNLGAISSVAFKHNNLFSAGEQFTLLGRIGYENLKQEAQDHLSYGFETFIRFPRALAPIWLRNKLFGGMKVTTDLKVSYDYNRRPEFNRNLLSGALGYNLQRFSASAYRHLLKILEVDYMHFGYIDENFRNSMPIITQLLNYRDQFVVGASYTFNYSSQKDYRYLWSPVSHDLRVHVQSAGAMLYGISSLLNGEQDKYGAYSLLKTNFVQFLKGELDYSVLHRLDPRTTLAYHIGVGAIYPYGNSRILPVDLRYFAGGANSIRGWSVRSLGPGSVPLERQQSIFDHVGDLKLELSAELRTRAFRSLEIALFADAGNIWTLRKYENQPQGEFRLNRFYKEIALAGGVGLRWDFDYFILRFDTGVKLYSPQHSEGTRWVIRNQPLKDLVAFHFALGYPF